MTNNEEVSAELVYTEEQCERMIRHWEEMSNEASRVGNIALAEARHNVALVWLARLKKFSKAG